MQLGNVVPRLASKGDLTIAFALVDYHLARLKRFQQSKLHPNETARDVVSSLRIYDVLQWLVGGFDRLVMTREQQRVLAENGYKMPSGFCSIRLPRAELEKNKTFKGETQGFIRKGPAPTRVH